MIQTEEGRLKEALLESLAVSRKGAGLRTAVITIAALPVVALLNMPALLIWLAALIVWNSMLIGPLERHWVLPAIERDLLQARVRRAAMVLFGLSLTQVMAVVAWAHGGVFAAIVAAAWVLCSATQVLIYYSRDRVMMVAGMAPVVLCGLLGPMLTLGFNLEALAASGFMMVGIGVGAAFVSRSDTLIAKAAEEAAGRRTAEAANSAKSRFIAAMHHELRTPLNAIIGYSELMRDDAVEHGRSADIADFDRILAAARLQLMMISDLMTFSELQDGRLQLELCAFDAAMLLREVGESQRTAVEENGNSFSIDIDAGLGAVCTDPAKLRHCLEHLLSNAGKFTHHGAVALRARRDGDALVISVRDTGIGIAPERMKAIFQPFAQSGEARTTPGAGIGLAITSRLARLLDGAVSVESTLGQGSTFTLRVRANAEGAAAEPKALAHAS